MKAKVILATILVLAASCVKNEVREVSMHGDGQILYNPAPLRSMTTKAVQTIDFPTTSTFGSCAWYLPGDNKWDDHHAAAATATVVPTPYIPTSEISNNEGQWKAWDSGKSYYWPMNGSLTFISWAPADLLDKVDASNNKLNSVTREEGFKITNWKMENTPGYGIVPPTSEGGVSTTDPNVDILLSYTKDCTRNTANGKVPTVFSHLLCKVKVVATLAKPLGTDEKPREITSVTLSNIYTKANYSTYVTYVEDGANKIKLSKLWREQDVPLDYVYPQAGGTSPSPTMTVTYKANTVIFPETMFLPQYLTQDGRTDRPKISIMLKDSKTPIEGYLYNDEILNSLSVWNQGKSITYVITIGNETAEIDFTAKVDGWSEYQDWIKDGISNIVPVQ